MRDVTALVRLTCIATGSAPFLPSSVRQAKPCALRRRSNAPKQHMGHYREK